MLDSKLGLTSSDISDQLRGLGIVRGNIIYVRSRLTAIGKIQRDIKLNLIKGIVDVIGEEGLLLVPSFTSRSRRWDKNQVVFNKHTIPRCGGLAKAVLQTAGAVRSAHPTHSFAALGSRAKMMLGDHDETKSAFYPMRHLIDANAKMLLIGCNPESPGFSTVHYVQNELGLSQQHFIKYFFSVLIEKESGYKKWCAEEDPGCSAGFDKLYKHYILDNNFSTGYVGNAYSILVRAGDAYRVEKQLLMENPRAVLCDSSGCLSCRILRRYNMMAAPLAIPYWIKNKYQRVYKKNEKQDT